MPCRPLLPFDARREIHLIASARAPLVWKISFERVALSLRALVRNNAEQGQVGSVEEQRTLTRRSAKIAGTAP